MNSVTLKTAWFPERNKLLVITHKHSSLHWRTFFFFFVDCVIDGVFVLQEDQRSERTITDLNVVMDASDLHNLSSFLSG